MNIRNLLIWITSTIRWYLRREIYSTTFASLALRCWNNRLESFAHESSHFLMQRYFRPIGHSILIGSTVKLTVDTFSAYQDAGCIKNSLESVSWPMAWRRTRKRKRDEKHGNYRGQAAATGSRVVSFYPEAPWKIQQTRNFVEEERVGREKRAKRSYELQESTKPAAHTTRRASCRSVKKFRILGSSLAEKTDVASICLLDEDSFNFVLTFPWKTFRKLSQILLARRSLFSGRTRSEFFVFSSLFLLFFDELMGLFGKT